MKTTIRVITIIYAILTAAALGCIAAAFYIGLHINKLEGKAASICYPFQAQNFYLDNAHQLHTVCSTIDGGLELK